MAIRKRKKELLVDYTSEISAEEFDFGIERLGHGIGGTVVVEVQDFIVVLMECRSYDVE